MTQISHLTYSRFAYLPSVLFAVYGSGIALTTINGIASATEAANFINVPANSVISSEQYVTHAAATEWLALGTSIKSFPAQWTWDATTFSRQPRAATPSDGLLPEIEQIRKGKVIATYRSFGSISTCSYTWPTATIALNLAKYAAAGCGPFGNTSHIDLFRVAHDGDTFIVHPAVYSGPENNIYIASRPDYYHDPNPHPPKNITIEGLTENGVRPVILNVPGAGDFASGQAVVYLWNNGNANQNNDSITIKNIDLAINENVHRTGKAGIYSNGSTNLTLEQMRVHGFEMESANAYGANGILTTGSDTGTLTLSQLELYDNGGVDGPAHNIYIMPSSTDPNYTVHMVNSWSHDAFYGHLFKSRAQINILEGNYFQGDLPKGGIFTQSENYLVNIPNGGVLKMRNNILVKNASGSNSNGASITYSDEGLRSDTNNNQRRYEIEVTNNTFVAFAKTYDGSHPLWPFFFYEHLIPDSSNFQVPKFPNGFVVPKLIIVDNVFVGYLPQTHATNKYMNYRGNRSISVSFNEIDGDFSLKSPLYSKNTSTAGTAAYMHPAQVGLKRKLFSDQKTKTKLTVVGAVD